MTVLRVVSPGLQLLVEDAGRPGAQRYGVPRSGFADPVSAALANRLVGNDDGEATLESLMGSVVLSNDSTSVVCVAVTGVDADVAVVVGTRVVARSTDAPIDVPSSGLLRIGPARAGLRAYIAVRGGIDVASTLGSRSHDTLSGLGPSPLQTGDPIPVGSRATGWPVLDHAVVAPPPRAAGTIDVRARLGPRQDWLDEDSLSRLGMQLWTVSSRADRIGIRLDGPPLRWNRVEELASEGTVRGAVQIPSDGQPFVLMADHPVTIGYPVAAVVTDTHAISRLAQAAPGCRVRFRLW